MDLTLTTLLTMARETVSDPRGGAKRIMAINLPLRDGWSALALMAVGSAVLTHLGFLLSPPAARDFFSDAMASPFRTAILQGLVMGLGAFAMFKVGVARGGHGTLPQAVALAAWLQFILLVLQVAQLAAQVLVPPLAALIGLLGLALFFWLLTGFVMQMHGFTSMPITFLGILATMVALGMVLAMVLGMFFGMPVSGV
ncbi:MAG: YIP1 family protein [Gemmobacter sp.]